MLNIRKKFKTPLIKLPRLDEVKAQLIPVGINPNGGMNQKINASTYLGRFGRRAFLTGFAALVGLSMFLHSGPVSAQAVTNGADSTAFVVGAELPAQELPILSQNAASLSKLYEKARTLRQNLNSAASKLNDALRMTNHGVDRLRDGSSVHAHSSAEAVAEMIDVQQKLSEKVAKLSETLRLLEEQTLAPADLLTRELVKGLPFAEKTLRVMDRVSRKPGDYTMLVGKIAKQASEDSTAIAQISRRDVADAVNGGLVWKADEAP